MDKSQTGNSIHSGEEKEMSTANDIPSGTLNDYFGVPDCVRLKKDITGYDFASDTEEKILLKAGTLMAVIDVPADEAVTVELYDGEHNYMADVRNEDIELVKRYCTYFPDFKE